MNGMGLHDIEDMACVNQGLIVAIVKALDSETREQLLKNLRQTLESKTKTSTIPYASSGIPWRDTLRNQAVTELLEYLEEHHQHQEKAP